MGCVVARGSESYAHLFQCHIAHRRSSSRPPERQSYLNRRSSDHIVRAATEWVTTQDGISPLVLWTIVKTHSSAHGFPAYTRFSQVVKPTPQVQGSSGLRLHHSLDPRGHGVGQRPSRDCALGQWPCESQAETWSDTVTEFPGDMAKRLHVLAIEWRILMYPTSIRQAACHLALRATNHRTRSQLPRWLRSLQWHRAI
jgi:hypothetical protein